jgi:hypothetical protein
MKRVLVLVEGQTEERFVKDVLSPALVGSGLVLTPTLLVTRRMKNGPDFKGGVTTFGKFENDIRRLLVRSGGALVTTMLDYYRLPDDFPGMGNRPEGSPSIRVEHVEKAIHRHFGETQNLVPFLALHEFEAWLFSSTIELPRVMTEPEREAEFAAIRQNVNSPEEINDRPEFSPSKRILKLFPGYKKALHGPITANRIGLPRIRTECPHFNDWMRKLENFAVL